MYKETAEVTDNLEDVSIADRSKFAAKMFVLRILSSTGHVILPYLPYISRKANASVVIINIYILYRLLCHPA